MNNASSTPMYPAALNHVVAVSATDHSDQLATFSNYGSWLDVSAPGVDIQTTNNGGGYGYWNGTSFSSAIVSGLTALVFSVNPALSNTQVVDLVERNSDDLGPVGFDASFGYGRVNAAKTLAAAKVAVPFVDVTPPTVSITSPLNNSTVSGTVTVNVSATDDIAVTKVDLYVDSSFFGTDTAAPYSFRWDTRRVASGLHQLVAKGYDAKGNVGVSATVTVKK